MKRDFDLIVYGATGYTGRLIAEYLATANGVLDYVDRSKRKRGLASASLKSGSMAASGPGCVKTPCDGKRGE